MKLEELLNKIHDCEAFFAEAILSPSTRHRVGANRARCRRSPDTLTTLYFPELKSEASAYIAQFRAALVETIKLSAQLASAKTDEIARSKIFETYNADFKTRYPAIQQARNQLNDAARKLILQIMG